MQITLAPIEDFTALGRRWQALERASNPNFFLSWAFLGCQAETRFAGARLLSVSDCGTDLALALIGGATPALNESGDALSDGLFIEHNGLLVRDGHHHAIAPALQHVMAAHGSLALSGIDDRTLAAARAAGWLEIHQTRLAPCIHLTALRGPYLETISANARAQIRRSLRLYGAPLRVARAQSLTEADSFFAEMVALHQASWHSRGKPGAFADPAIRAFHTTLVARAWPTGGVELVRVSAADRHIGTLYTFIAGGRVFCYQSGFAYAADDAREKPGLVCHSLAVEFYRARGAMLYDLLAGAERYKTTLARDGEKLHWATLRGRCSLAGLVGRGKSLLRRKH